MAFNASAHPRGGDPDNSGRFSESARDEVPVDLNSDTQRPVLLSTIASLSRLVPAPRPTDTSRPFLLLGGRSVRIVRRPEGVVVELHTNPDAEGFTRRVGAVPVSALQQWTHGSFTFGSVPPPPPFVDRIRPGRNAREEWEDVYADRYDESTIGGEECRFVRKWAVECAPDETGKVHRVDAEALESLTTDELSAVAGELQRPVEGRDATLGELIARHGCEVEVETSHVQVEGRWVFVDDALVKVLAPKAWKAHNTGKPAPAPVRDPWATAIGDNPPF